MNAEETGRLLAVAAFYDNRKVDTPTVLAWHQVIGDLDYADAEVAVRAHYGGDATERLMPGHIRTGVRRIRSERIAKTVIPAPPAELADNPRAYQRALRDATKLAGDGNVIPFPKRPAIETGDRSGDLYPASLRQAISGLRKTLGPGRAPRPAIGDERQAARDQVAEMRAAREDTEGGETA